MERPPGITNEEEWLQSCREIVRIAKEILDRSISLTEGASYLVKLHFEVRAEHDPDFITFVGLASETDRFPVGKVRDHWSVEALERYDHERAVVEGHWRAQAEEASRNLVSKYKATA